MTAPHHPIRPVTPQKSLSVAYLLLICLGGFGAHRFYLGYTNSGLVMLALFVTGLVLSLVLVGLIPLAVLVAWWIADLFLLPGMTREKNTDEYLRYKAVNSL